VTAIGAEHPTLAFPGAVGTVTGSMPLVAEALARDGRKVVVAGAGETVDLGA
jgi:hypothetical protein